MTTLLATSFLAQRADWIDGAVILVIFALSVLGSLGKWIVQQIADHRERNARQREGMPINPPRTDGTPAPMPPVFQGSRKAGTPHQPPVMDKVMEVLLEKAAGTKLERRIREMMPSQPPPPPRPAQEVEPRVRKQTTQRTPPRQAPKRPMTVVEREATREKVRQTEVERETKRLVQREEQFTDDANLRLGHVETHIAALDAPDSAPTDAFELSISLDDPNALRRAFILSEILAPPLALRGELSV